MARLELPRETLPARVNIVRSMGKAPVGDIGRPIMREQIKAAWPDFT